MVNHTLIGELVMLFVECGVVRKPQTGIGSRLELLVVIIYY